MLMLGKLYFLVLYLRPWQIFTEYYSGSPVYKDHVPEKVEGVVIPKPTHHIQQCLLVNMDKFNQQHTDVNLLNELS